MFEENTKFQLIELHFKIAALRYNLSYKERAHGSLAWACFIPAVASHTTLKRYPRTKLHHPRNQEKKMSVTSVQAVIESAVYSERCSLP